MNRLKLDINIKCCLYHTADLEIKAYIRKNLSFMPVDELPEENIITEEIFPSMTGSAFYKTNTHC